MNYRIDAMSLRDGTLVIEGWAIGSNEKKVKIHMTDLRGNPVPCTAVERDRADVMQQFGADRMCGFTAAAPFDRGMDGYLVLTDGPVVRKIRVNESVVRKKNSIRTKRAEKLLALCHMETLQVAWDFYKENGLKALWKKSIHKIRKIDEDYDYPEWEAKTRMSDEEIRARKEEWKTFAVKPLISVVIPAYNTGEQYLRMLFDSLENQIYPNLEIIVADGSDRGDSVRRVTEEYAAKAAEARAADPLRQVPCFVYAGLGGNRGIAGNTNAGLEAASGSYIALCDHDDELPPSAFFAVVKAINENPGAQFLYTDEDKIDFDGKAVFEPHFKPDYDPELLTSVNYICHLSVIRRDLLAAVGGFRPEYDGAQDLDFFLRCTETAVREETEKLRIYRRELRRLSGSSPENSVSAVADCGLSALTEDSRTALAETTGFTEKDIRALLEGRFTSAAVVHVPEICYHWRYHKGSTAENPQSKLYAFEAGARAVKAHYARTGVDCSDVEKGVTYGYYHTCFRPDMFGQTKVSIIIPNKDHTEDLDKCIRSIIKTSDFRNIEFVIVENNSKDDKTFDYYRKIDNNPAYFLQENGTCTDGTGKCADEAKTCADEAGKCADSAGSDTENITVRIVTWEREFNYSAINNFGARFATGDMFLLLNNDVEIISPSAITELVAYCSREEIGAAGARLNYGDDTIQHAGVIVGLGGIAGAAFVGLHEKENSYMHRMMCVQDYSAVTAACLMVRREVFEEVGGLREELAVAFNDIDFCMKIRARGYRVVYDAYSNWHHYESKSRGLEDTPEKVRRFNGEIVTFAKYWGPVLRAGDPYYHPALTLRKANFALKDLTKEKIGEPYKLDFDIEEQLKTVQREKQRRGLQ